MYRKVAMTVKKTTAGAAAGIVAALFLLLTGTAMAELPAPNFMPGFPMIAGPQLMIMWTPVPGAAKYKVFLDNKEVAETAAFQHFMAAPEKAGTHEIKVIAIAGDGSQGKPSDVKTVKVIKLEPPANLAGRMVEGSFGLNWDAAPGAMIYNIYRSAVSGKDYRIVASVQDTRHADKEFPKDKKSFYAVTAKDATGAESAFSKELVLDPQALEKAEQEAQKVRKKIEAKFLPVKEPTCVKAGAFGMLELPTPVARDSQGNLYVGDIKGRIVVFNDRMKFVRQFPSGEDGYKLPSPMGLLFDNDEQVLYASDRLGIKKLNLEGKLIAESLYAKLKEGKDVRRERNMLVNTFAADGDTLYVSDNQNRQLLVLNKNLEFQRVIDISKLCGPIAGLTITKEGNFLFLDNLGARVIETTKDFGKVLVSFGEYGAAPGMIGRPNFVFKDASGSYMVGDGMLTRIHVFDAKGEYRFNFGKSDKEMLPVISPGGAAFDPQTRRLWYSQSLEHNFCVVEVPTL